MLIGSLVSSIKVSLVRFTRKRFIIYESNVSLEDRRADVSRGQRLFAFTVYTAYYRVLTATSISRNFLEGKSNSISTSRQLLRKVDRRVPVLSQRVNSYCSAVYISTFFTSETSDKFAYSDSYSWQCFLCFAYPRLKIKWVNESKLRISLFCS